MSNFGFRLSKIILGPIFRIYYRPTIVNKEYIPTSGPIILCGNHKHVYDQNLALLATHRVVNYMAKKEYFDGKFAWFFKFAGCISVNRSIKDTEATEQAINILNSGGAIGLFPEGIRNKTNATLVPFKFGAVSLAYKTNATIVPFGITGEYKFKNNHLKIEFGKPFKVENDNLELYNDKLYDTIKNLITK